MIIVDWNYSRLCNFDCAYCLNDPADKHFIGPTFTQVKAAVDRLKKEYFFSFTGGEIFLNKDFVKSVKYVTQRFPIGIYSNLSLPMDEFIKEIDPKRVKFIVAALHIKERDRRNIPREQIVLEHGKLKAAGFGPIYVIQICDSYALSNYDDLFDWYKARGILVIPNRLKNSPWFTQAYTAEEEEKMMHYVKETRCTLFPFEMAEYLNRQGQQCFAGNKYIVITANGRIRKCWGDRTKYYGNFYQPKFWDENTLSDTPTTCEVTSCACYPCTLHYAEMMDTTSCK